MKDMEIATFILIDDLCSKHKINHRLNIEHNQSHRISCLWISEIFFVLLEFNHSSCRYFNRFYESFLEKNAIFFPFLPSYSRFMEIKEQAIEELQQLEERNARYG